MGDLLRSLPAELELLNKLPPLAISPKLATPLTFGSLAGVSMCVAHHMGVNIDFATAVGIMVVVFGFFGWIAPSVAVVVRDGPPASSP